MKKIQNFKEFSAIYEANILSKGLDLVKKAGSWLMNLVKAQDNKEIPVRDKKYNPESGSFETIETPTPVVKIHLPENYSGGNFKYATQNIPLQMEGKTNEANDPAWKIAQKTQDPEIDDVEAPELKRELAYHFSKPETGRPLLIWGAPGIGKTSIVKDFGLSDKGVPVIEVILSLMEPTDVAGLPGTKADERNPDVKRSVNYLPMIWPLDNGPEDKGGIIFLDEINRAHPSVQAAMLKVVLDREIAGAGYKIPSKWLILAAANRPEDEPGAMIRPMSFALANRFAQVNLISDPESWTSWARTKDLSDDVVTFVELMQDYFYMMPGALSTYDTTMGVTPRAWDYAAREYQDRKDAATAEGRELTQEETAKIFNKHLGKKVSSVITDFLETIKVWPANRIAMIYTDPTNPQVELPTNSQGVPDLKKAYAVMYMVSKYKPNQQLTKEEFSNLITYLTKLSSGEIAMSGLNLTKRTHPEIKNYLGDTSLEKYVTPFVSKYKAYMKEI
jgi:hypothetical protein